MKFIFYLFSFYCLLFINLVVGEEKHLDLPMTPVTANPLGVSSDEFVVPITVLNGKELNIQRGINIGETLSSTPGVTFTNWGPTVARPVIRGLDGDRIRILQNGVNFLDVSSFSADHSVPIDPLIIEQIDVIRGPATLIYGGGAVGGVVNAIDHRIPKEAVSGFTGRAETRAGGYNSERSSAVVMDVGNDQFAIHFDAYTKTTGNLNIPGYAVSKKLARSDSSISRSQYGKNKLNNSGQDTEGGAIGTSFFLEKGYIGVSYAMHDSQFGNPLQSSGYFDLKMNRWDIHSELHDLDGFFNHFKLKLAHTDYQHQEIESGGDVGTEFKNRGLDGTIELGHHAIAGSSGVVGLQFENTFFQQPVGDALLPNSNTNSQSIYIYEELPIEEHKITFGLRRGNHDVRRSVFVGDGGCTTTYSTAVGCGVAPNVGEEDAPEFGDIEKSFKTNNASVGGVYKINDSFAITSNLTHSERAPAFFELFPYGSHHATETVQKGNENLSTELSNSIDFQLKWNQGSHHFSIGPYYTRFNRFIGLFNTGSELYHLHDGESQAEALDVYQYQQVGASFKGIEFDGRFQVNNQLAWLFRGDYVRAKQSNGDDLPRISPLRIGTSIDYQKNAFFARLDVLRAFNQSDIGSNELSTPAYTNITAYASYKLPLEYNLEFFMKGYNLLDQEIRDHASLMKDKIPMGGRSVLFGLRGEF